MYLSPSRNDLMNMQYIEVSEVVTLLKRGDGENTLLCAAARFPNRCQETVDNVMEVLQSFPDDFEDEHEGASSTNDSS